MSALDVMFITLVFVGFAVLRFGAPLLITWLIGRLMQLLAPPPIGAH